MPTIYTAYKRISDKNLLSIESGENAEAVRDAARNNRLVKNDDEIIVTKSSEPKLEVFYERFFVHGKEKR